jgi:hypothetical protein
MKHGPLASLMALSVLALASCRTAPVVPPRHEPPAVQQPAATREVVTWEVSPAGGYRDERSYVSIDYEPPDMAGGGAAAGANAAPGGRIVVHLGHRAIGDGNTKWFSFQVLEGGRLLLEQDGDDDIPNVKGPDGYWWNDVPLDLPAPIAREARVTVSNAQYGAEYDFTVTWRARRE